jgi:cellulose synthase/poly-beta-1,6-N-acetylglucosamine synthase-like glycosyltransferase
MGTGMAFPWHIIEAAPLASGHLVEDLQLGLELAGTGAAPQFCPGALVTSEFPLHAEARATQRTRWEHGHIAIMATAPRLLVRALATRQGALAALVFDLCVPPLAALVLLCVLMVVLGAVLTSAGGDRAPLGVSLVALLALLGAVLLAWHRFGRDLVSLRELFSAPIYAFAKLPVYAALLTKRQLAWVRTHRGDKPPEQ